jgi:hypothetical protein
MKCLLGDEDVWSLVLEYWLKNAITFDSIVDHPQTFTEAVFLGVATKWLLGEEDVWSVELEYLLKGA